MQINKILKDSDYKLELFSEKAIKDLEARIIDKPIMGGGINKAITPLALCEISKSNLPQKRLSVSCI